MIFNAVFSELVIKMLPEKIPAALAEKFAAITALTDMFSAKYLDSDKFSSRFSSILW